jgi:hypothetical protein
MLTTLPFQGFYQSIFDSGLDQVQEYNLESLAEEHQVDQRIIADALWKATDYRKAYLYIAEQYVYHFNDYLAENFDLNLNLTFESLQSPREYNFETDRIFCHISLENLRKLRAAVPDDELRLAIKVRFTSRSGFISSYPNDLDDWNPDVTTWDHNEIGTLFVALLGEGGDFEEDIYESMSDRNVFDNAFDRAVDWTKFEEFVAIEKEEASA